jgi:hypothetical protein
VISFFICPGGGKLAVSSNADHQYLMDATLMSYRPELRTEITFGIGILTVCMTAGLASRVIVETVPGRSVPTILSKTMQYTKPPVLLERQGTCRITMSRGVSAVPGWKSNDRITRPLPIISRHPTRGRIKPFIKSRE